ncbi:MAG: C4-dicarboxylate transporter DctA [Bacteroidota bacterium]|nr:C4-dicarboxylate transporter DctA [Candidatus Kapabacteria bacterium]MDW8218921.1 C4-dicarboxylate transporter DctA [Bacteroidota bacterium]
MVLLHEQTTQRQVWYKNLTVRVVLCMCIGIVLGMTAPEAAVLLKPLADIFVKLVKMVIAPIVFITIVTGIAAVGNLRTVGSVGIKAFVYFQITTVAALGIGLAVVNVVQPGYGIDVSGTARADVSRYTRVGEYTSALEFVMNIVPEFALGAFIGGNMLQVLFFALVFGVALAGMGENGAPICRGLERIGAVFFRIVSMIMQIAPLGALGAIAFTVGTFGLEALAKLAQLMGAVYLACAIFVFGMLNAVLRYYKVSLWNVLRGIRDELWIVLGTSSSESVLPRIMTKLERFGCSKHIVGLVVPTGYSFNLDGTAIYLAMATIFIAQAFAIKLSFAQQLSIMGILLITSKGAAGVTGSGFVTLAATLSATHILPVEGLALLLGVDRFMSEARALTNLVGNVVATIAVACSEGEFQMQTAAFEKEE